PGVLLLASGAVVQGRQWTARGGGHGVSVRGADQVLFGGVAVVPVERCVEEALGEGGDCARVVADGCTGGDALEFLATGHPVAQSTQQHCQFGGLGPVVDVCLVHGDELPVPGVFAFEQV